MNTTQLEPKKQRLVFIEPGIGATIEIKKKRGRPFGVINQSQADKYASIAHSLAKKCNWTEKNMKWIGSDERHSFVQAGLQYNGEKEIIGNDIIFHQ